MGRRSRWKLISRSHFRLRVSFGASVMQATSQRSLIMENEHTYRVVAWWASGKTGLVKSDSAPNAIHFTTPPQFGGMEGRWSPEDLLLSAVASCFTSTFHALAEHSSFHFTDLEVEVQGCVNKSESGYMFSE